jgi:hypothetical protein
MMKMYLFNSPRQHWTYCNKFNQLLRFKWDELDEHSIRNAKHHLHELKRRSTRLHMTCR